MTCITMFSYNLCEKEGSSTASTSDNDSMKRRMSTSVQKFQATIKEVLSPVEQEDITHILSCYHRKRNVYYLTESLKSLLDTSEKRMILPVLKQILPKADRDSFDQYTCEKPYTRSLSSSSRVSSVSHMRTNDSGIGSNEAGYCSSHRASNSSSNVNTQSRRTPQPPPRRSSSLSDLSQKSPPKSGKSFSASTFGSAVRRKVRSVLSRRGSSSSIELKSSVQRRHSSETQLNKIGQDGDSNSKGSNRKRSGSFRDRLRSKHHVKQKDLVCISLVRQTDKEFGFTIGGGSDVGSEIFVSDVDPGSPADLSGLKKHDMIVKVNEIPFGSGISHDMAAGILSTVENLTMYVKPSIVSKVSAEDVPWMDVHGRSTSPPHSISKKNRHSKPVLDSRRSSLHLLQAGERKVTLTVKPRQSLGLMIRGGSEFGLGIYVTGVDSLSAAENAGLKPGDEILEVNSIPLEGVSHSEAVRLIKSSPLLIMIVRYVGRIPQNQHVSVSSKMVDDRVSLHSSATGKKVKPGKENQNGMRAAFQRKLMMNNQMILPNMLSQSPHHQSAIKVSSTMSTLEEALLASDVWMTLSDSERRSLRYYVKEYATGSVSPDALVLALSELLDNQEKFTLMSAVRECIAGKDLDRFDVLVLRREVDTLRKSRQPEEAKNASIAADEQSNPSSVPEDFHSSLTSVATDDDVLPQDEPIASSHHHSTPNNSLDNAQNNQLSAVAVPPKLSPVRPICSPPPLPCKAPPVKPKRRSSTSRKALNDKQDANVNNHVTSSTEEEHVYSVVNKQPNKLRPSSPFALALENHISPHSGRVKAGTKASSHAPIPSPSFYRERNHPSNTVVNSREKPTFSSFIKPVKNPSIKLLKNKAKESIIPTPLNPPDLTPKDSYPSEASSTSSSSDSIDVSMSKLSFRPVTFGSVANEKAAKLSSYPVKVDVHRQPSVKKQEGPRPIIIRDYENPPISAPSAMNDSHTEDSCGYPTNTSDDEDDVDRHPCLAADVDTQKIVIFKTASTLGLTIEGGAGTKQPLPRVIKVQRGSCSQMCGRVRTGHVIHKVNGKSLKELSHHDAVRVIALAFKQEDRDSIELVLSGPY